MRELSLHILDIVENGITAGGNCIWIEIDEARKTDQLNIVIRDNGHGMPAEKMKNINDPFITSRTTRRVGLGLSLLAAAAERCDGTVRVDSQPGKGTEVKATFRYSHIDRAPLGDIAATVTTLIIGHPEIDFVYSHRIDDKDFSLDTREIRSEIEDTSLSDPVVIHHLTKSIRSALKALASDEDNFESLEEQNGKVEN
ncbi:MAG: ATP-binding protein [Desulfobacterales bacterium]|jgi:anti-sigma regulatory factor (Ser/Thr protein kinase)